MRIYITVVIVAGVLCTNFTAPAAEQVETEYFAVFMEQSAAADSNEQSLGKKTGYAIQTRTVRAGKVTTTIQFSMTISRFGTPVAVKTAETFIETVDGKALGFESVQLLSGTEIKSAGMIDEQGMINLTVESMGVRQETTLQWPQGAVMAEAARLLTLKMGLKEGVSYNTKIFIPSMIQAFDTEVRIGRKSNVDLLGRVVALTEVTSTMQLPMMGQVTGVDYVDDELRVQKSIIPMMGIDMVIIACDRQFALSSNEPFEYVNQMSLPSPQPIENINSISSINYYLKPVGPEDRSNQNTGETLTVPSTGSQDVTVGKDGRIVVTVRAVAAAKGAKFPYQGNDAQILAATGPTMFIQSDHKKIVELARLATGDTKDAAEAVKKIEAFVADYIQIKDLSVGYASAAEVAQSRQGDCSEFAVLTTALCRAVGIPARVVMGVAYIDDFGGLKNHFVGHAWVEAYLGDKWVGLDAAFKSGGKKGFGPGHIALAVGNGDPKDFFGMVTTLGKFKIEKMVIDRDK